MECARNSLKSTMALPSGSELNIGHALDLCLTITGLFVQKVTHLAASSKSSLIITFKGIRDQQLCVLGTLDGKRWSNSAIVRLSAIVSLGSSTRFRKKLAVAVDVVVVDDELRTVPMQLQ
ncbi:hypothetical protein Tco_1104739 [Tanacetum coccineum]